MRFMRVVLLVGLTGGCGLAGADNDLRDLEVSLAAATTIGQSGALALSAMEGSGSVQCASVVTQCTEYPCEGEVRIDYGAGCPLPLGGEAIGSTTVTGTWMSGEEAVLDFAFTDVRVGERSGVVVSATTIDVSRVDGVTSVEFVGTQAVARGAVAVAATSNWDVLIDDAGTPGDSSDDIFTIDGSSTAAGGVQARVVQVDEARIEPGCRLNPVGGTASITESGLSIRTDEITFGAACDGTAELEPTLGGARTVSMDFLED
ncbi:MAG: hypothetical protein AB8I08_38910 [Sandaracinaceae bacterium]